MSYAFWLILLQVVWVDVMLSGDNAVVIALACRGLEGNQKTLGMAMGAGAAIAIRIVATIFIATLVTLPYLSIVGAAALLYVAVKMVMGNDGDEADVKHSSSLWSAVAIIAVADASMSLDNVVAIAAIAKGNYEVIVGGLILSIVIVMVGAKIITSFIDRFPILVWAGGALLGWIAGGMLATDPIVIGSFLAEGDRLPSACAIFVVGYVWLRKNLDWKMQG
jgi:YjbE family integral membrane protein